MYSQKYRRNHEITGMTVTLKSVPDKGPTPPESVELAEEGSLLERLLREAVTPEEHTLLCLLDELADEMWRLKTGKALRSELRRLFMGQGFSKRRFYAAFHRIEKRVCL